MTNGYKLVDFGGASRDISGKQIVDGIYKSAKEAADCKIPIRDINMLSGTKLSLSEIGSNFNRCYKSGTNVIVEVGGGKIATIGSDNGVTFSAAE